VKLKETEIGATERVSFWYLMITFLKVGSTSFGGHMSLISVVQDQMVSKDRVIDNETILDGISLASVLPGPFAVNVVTFIGYKLRGFWGGVVSLIMIMIPSFTLVYVLSVLYFSFQETVLLNNILKGIVPAVCVIIFFVAFGMSKKNISNYRQLILLIISCLTLIFFSSFITIVALMLFGGGVGYFYFQDKTEIKQKTKDKGAKGFLLYKYIIVGVALIAFVSGFSFFFDASNFSNLLKLASVFSGMSLTLFGGGYVFIPIMQEIVVDTMGWLTVKEFVDGIAMGQVTPGPIMISAVFIGYKVMGFWGSFIAAIAMFLPSGVLTIMCSKFMLLYSGTPKFKAVLKGVHAIAVGMIYAAVYKVGIEINLNWQVIVIVVLSAILLFKFKLNAVYIIPISAILGHFIFRL